MTFWSYFKQTLRWPLIFRSGPLAMLVDGGAASLDVASSLVLWLRSQFLPATCNDELLDRFAAARGLSRSALETTESYQQRVRTAYIWWMRGGRACALDEVLLASYGATSADVVSLRDSDPERWAEFQLVLHGSTGLVALIEQINWIANELKPARSKLAGVEIIIDQHTTHLYGTGVQISMQITINRALNIDPSVGAELYVRSGYQIISAITIL